MFRRFCSALLLCCSLGCAELVWLARVQAQDARALLQQSIAAMGGMPGLRSVKNQVVEAEGKQYDWSATPRPLGPTRQIATFRYILSRDLTKPRLRLEWDSRHEGRNINLRFIEVIDGDVGLLQQGGSGGKQSRMHPARVATRLREEQRAAPKLLLNALAQKNLRRLADADIDGKRFPVVAFGAGADEFRIHLDPRGKLPARVEILESDPLEGDSLYTLSYGDWLLVRGVMTPFSLRFTLNGKPLQDDRIISVQNNLTQSADTFIVPPSIRAEKVLAKPIASQWLLRRVAGNVSYQALGTEPPVEFAPLGEGLHLVHGTSHNTVVIELRDHLVAVEGPLYEERSQQVIQAIKKRFPNKPIRYIIPTHHHLDHAGGIRGFMAEGATVVTPVTAAEFYRRVARSPQTIRPDSLEKSGRAFALHAHGGYYTLDDGQQRVEVYGLPTSHAEDLQVIYLPRQKIIIEADHISPRKGKIAPSPRVTEFVERLATLNLDVATIVGIHGDSGSMEATRAAARGTLK